MSNGTPNNRAGSVKNEESSADGSKSPNRKPEFKMIKAEPEPNVLKKLEYYFLPYNQEVTPYKHMKFDTEPPVVYDFDGINRQM